MLKSFSLSDSYNNAQMSRAKPWDDRELDAIEGFKFWSFKLTTISQTCFSLCFTNLVNLFGLLDLLTNPFVTAFIECNLAMEVFLFLSCFTTIYRTF